MTANGEDDNLIKPEGTVDYTFERPPAPETPASEDTLAEDGGVHAHVPGEIEPCGSDEESDILASEEDAGGADDGDLLAPFAKALPQEEGGAGWVRVGVPAVDRTLQGAAIMFRFGDQVGWCVGRVKRFYPTLYGGKFNVEVKYEDGDTMDHFLSADSYVGAEIVGADLDNVVPPGSWVVIEKPK